MRRISAFFCVAHDQSRTIIAFFYVILASLPAGSLAMPRIQRESGGVEIVRFELRSSARRLIRPRLDGNPISSASGRAVDGRHGASDGKRPNQGKAK
jgi:hypothetical protein